MRTVSPLAGLRRRSLGEVEVLAQSVSVTAPTAAIASTPALVAASAGGATLWAYGVAIVAVALLTLVVRAFSARLAAPGSLYTYVAQGLGPLPGVVAGSALAVGYAVLSMATTVLTAWYLLALGARSGRVAPHPGGALTVTAVVLVGLVLTACLVRGIGTSSRVALGVEGVAVVLVVGGVVAALVTLLAGARTGLPPVGGSPTPTAPVGTVLADMLRGTGGDLTGLLHGAGLALASFIGFESAAALGGEARRPLVTIPRVVGRTVAVVSGLYLLAALAQLLAFGSDLGAQDQPMVELATTAQLPWAAAVLDVAVACSGFACAAGSATALARLLFAMARERSDEAPLGVTHPRSHTPHNAILASMAAVVAVPVALVLGGLDARAAFTLLLTVSTVGYVVAYVLVCLALPVFLRRLGEPVAGRGAAGLLGAVVLGVLLVGVTLPAGRDTPSTLLPPLVVTLAIAVSLGRHRRRTRRDPDLTARIGFYDEPVLSDLHPSHRGPHRVGDAA
ncbi:APC family permease [Dermatophilaceae bacterium Soc4.6]